MYENCKLHGPYIGKDGRLRCVLVFPDKTKRTLSYPKYLMEIHLNRFLEKDETVDHIDLNPLNNEISNLRVINRKEHCTQDVLRNKNITVECAYCGKTFNIEGSKIHNRNRKDKTQSGYFCSKSCSGKYGKDIQLKKIKPFNKVEKVQTEKFRLKNLSQ